MYAKMPQTIGFSSDMFYEIDIIFPSMQQDIFLKAQTGEGIAFAKPNHLPGFYSIYPACGSIFVSISFCAEVDTKGENPFKCMRNICVTYA